MNHRLTVTTAAAVVLASISLYPLIQGIGWFWAGFGAVIVAAAAGSATRLPALPAGAIATVLALGAAAPLLVNPGWYWELLGLVIVICAAASVTRLRLLPAVAGLITYLAGLLLYLNLVFAGPESIGWIVPTRMSIRHLWHLASQGLAERSSLPPVLGHHGVELLAAAGIGLIAVAADLIAVRLRSPAIAGLPLLALFSVPITTSARQGAVGATLTFCLGITGYLALLAADGRERLRIWGRLVTVWQSSTDDDEPVRGPDTRVLAASGRRIGLTAISLAIFIPLLLPGLRVHKLFSGHGGAGGGGTATFTLPDPIDQMQRMLQSGGNATVLTYHSTDPTPQYQYLQIQVLNYDTSTDTWSPQAPSTGDQLGPGGSLPAIPGLSPAVEASGYNTRVTVSNGVTGYSAPLTFLPLPYAATYVNLHGNGSGSRSSWQVDPTTLMVFASHAPLSGLAYTVTSDDVEPSLSQLEAAKPAPARIVSQYVPFPSPARAELLGLAKRITASASTPYQKALLLKNWFLSGGGFTYSTHVNEPSGTAGLVQFLTKTKSGDCQQFAFAMAALARLIGIPSRIAVGYTAGMLQPNGSWKVTQADAHAWPEFYFSGAGWIRLEPTPGGRNGQGTATQPVYAQTNSQAGSNTTPTGPVSGVSPGAKPSTGTNSNLGRRIVPGAGGSGTAAGHGRSAPVIPIAIVVLALLAIGPRTIRTAVRQRRWRTARDDGARADAAWRELHDDLTDYGIGWRASESPRAVAHRIAATLQLDAQGRHALDRIALAEERARYARAAQAPDSLRADVAIVRRALTAEAGRTARWRARLLPLSALAPVRTGMQHALDVFGWLDAAGLRVRRQVHQLGAGGPGRLTAQAETDPPRLSR
jgi:transglutaminase-like putative cysteine protease